MNDLERVIRDITTSVKRNSDRIQQLYGQLGGGSSGGTDPYAIHDNVAGEIHAITAKLTGSVVDNVVIEDSADGWAKKRMSLSAIRDMGESVYADISDGVTNGNSHDHSGGDGAQINHTTLSNIGTNTHAQIDSHIALTNSAHGGFRERLTANRTYYIRTDGNNSNTGLVNSAGGAFLTVQKGVDTISGLDINGYTVTIQVADGTYNTPVVLKDVVGYSAPGCLVINGNAVTPWAVWIFTTSADAVYAGSINSVWTVQNLYFRTASSGAGLHIYGSQLNYANCAFGPTAGAHIMARGGALITATGDSWIWGGGVQHWLANASQIWCQNRTVTLLDNAAFTSYFVASNFASVVVATNVTFAVAAGAYSGARYGITGNGVIYGSSGNVNYFPGNAAGVVNTGGQYM